MKPADIFPRDWLDMFSRGNPRIGLGLDIATTAGGKSNPSAFVACQQVTYTHYFRFAARFKTDDPAVTRAIIDHLILGLGRIGLRPRRLSIDATNERYFAVDLRRLLAGRVPVELVVSSENTIYGGEKMSVKAYLGNLLINALEDGYAALPPDGWIKTDFRQVVRDRGTFTAEVLDDGGHADVFDGCKLALHAVTGKGGPAKADAAATGTMNRARAERSGIRNPLARNQRHSSRRII